MKSTAKELKKIRLQVFLSRNGVCSRREAMRLIQSGHVSLNGGVNTEPSTPVDPDQDHVEVDGRVINVCDFHYLILNKPAGYVTTKKDTHDRQTVFDLLPKNMAHLNPAGRLDKDTEGLLLFSNDGDFIHRLSHPSFEIDKVYNVIILGKLQAGEKNSFEKGIVVEGRRTAPAKISDVDVKGNKTHLTVLIHEGRKRQIRMMFSQLGYKVLFLKRTAQGPLTLGGLKKGKWRKLSEQEINSLKKALA